MRLGLTSRLPSTKELKKHILFFDKILINENGFRAWYNFYKTLIKGTSGNSETFDHNLSTLKALEQEGIVTVKSFDNIIANWQDIFFKKKNELPEQDNLYANRLQETKKIINDFAIREVNKNDKRIDKGYDLESVLITSFFSIEMKWICNKTLDFKLRDYAASLIVLYPK